jgi:uncharacterized protein (TIGR04255 family)
MTSVMTQDEVEPRELPALAHPPLRLALLQARTVPVLVFEQPARVQELAEALNGRWIVTDRQTNREMALAVGPGGITQQAGTPETVWVLTCEDGRTRAAVSASSVAVESERYEDWPHFHAAALELFQAVQRVAAPVRCTRLGLRYINELHDERADGDPERLAELVNRQLIAAALALGRPVASSLTELRVHEDTESILVLRHGLVAPGVYLLDFDAYHEAAQAFDASALLARADEFHARIEAVFAWTLTETYLTQLVGQGASGGEAAQA